MVTKWWRAAQAISTERIRIQILEIRTIEMSQIFVSFFLI
jgi:hypothetical protein